MEAELILASEGLDFNLLNLFLLAGFVVQCVMVLLILASIICWAIIFQKLLFFGRVRKQTLSFENAFWSEESVEELYDRIKGNPIGALQRIFCAAMDEWEKSHSKSGVLISGASSRIDRSMSNAVNNEINTLSRGLDFLATVGSTAPFVGLFGTVWGIMNVFSEIGIQENTNLAVIAPGIGEALAATALGLLAAIPAVVFYNNLSTKANSLAARFDDFADEFSTIVSREIEQMVQSDE
ncbi:MAG: protein TolQ [Paracoccaceae bacterium]|nr:protein TolQ [Paracoccaceae bacterium]